MSGHGQSYWPPLVNNYKSMELTHGEIETFVTLYKKIISNQRAEVRIAATRLVDADNRISSVDSLLDAMIGLEALLNPSNNPELSFRVALNYASLRSSADRRNGYENIRAIYKTRSKIVHGDVKILSTKAALIHEHAELAKQCLRYAINRFLFDDAFAGTTKLEDAFWEDRVIPPPLVPTLN